MSRETERNYQNIIWRIGNVTPTYTRAGLKATFWSIDDTRLQEDQNSGLTRSFKVYWINRSEYQEPVSGPRRYATHRFNVAVNYDLETYTNYNLNLIVANDQDDISRALDVKSSWVGYSASYPSVSINLASRIVSSVNLVKEDNVYLLQFDVDCIIREDG